MFSAFVKCVSIVKKLKADGLLCNSFIKYVRLLKQTTCQAMGHGFMSAVIIRSMYRGKQVHKYIDTTIT